MGTAQTKAPNAIDIAVGRRIRQRRAMLGFSQTKLATELGVTFQQVQKYEKGVNRVGSSRLQSIARVLEVSVSYFFDELEASRSKQATNSSETLYDFVLSAEGLELNRAFLSLPNETVRRKFVAMVKALADDHDERDTEEAHVEA